MCFTCCFKEQLFISKHLNKHWPQIELAGAAFSRKRDSSFFCFSLLFLFPPLFNWQHSSISNFLSFIFCAPKLIYCTSIITLRVSRTAFLSAWKMDMAVDAQWHLPLIFQARSNPAGVVISNSFHINGSSLGSVCAKAGFSNLNWSPFLFSTLISLSDHLSYRCCKLSAHWCFLCLGLYLCVLANVFWVLIHTAAPLSWRRQRTRNTASWVTPRCLQTHMCCYNTERRTCALLSMSSLGPVRDSSFIGFFSFSSSGEQSQASWNLPSTPAADERSGLQPSHLSWPLKLPCHKT